MHLHIECTIYVNPPASESQTNFILKKYISEAQVSHMPEVKIH